MVKQQPARRRLLVGGVLAGAALTLAALHWPSAALAGDAASQRANREMRVREKRLLRRVQAALKAAGHDPGPIDGVWGAQTSAAVKAFQKSKNLETTGELGPKTMNALLR